MGLSNPPPQAYTKETVAQAYEWLFEQSASVREMATNLDSMVALFLQAKRRRSNTAGISSNPVSAKAFKEELKGLAEGFKQFESEKVGGGAPPTPATKTPSPSASTGPLPKQQLPRTEAHFSSTKASIPAPSINSFETSTVAPHPTPPLTEQQLSFQSSPSTPAKPLAKEEAVAEPLTQTDISVALPPSTTLGLDDTSVRKAQWVQQTLNLSSESEALRMLVTLGYEQVKKILP